MLYSLKEVAALIQVDYPELEDRARNGEFSAVEEEGRWVVRWHDLEPWFQEKKKSTTTG